MPRSHLTLAGCSPAFCTVLVLTVLASRCWPQCGPPTYPCSSQRTVPATVPPTPNVGGSTGVNSKVYSYSKPSDFFYPSSGVGNCITRLTDSNSHNNSSFTSAGWGGAGNAVMYSKGRSYGIFPDFNGPMYYASLSYDSNRCMTVNNPVLTTTSPGGSGGGLAWSKVTNNVLYHINFGTENNMNLDQETVTGTNPVTISNTTVLFNYGNCPGVPTPSGVTGGFGQLSVDNTDRYYETTINFESGGQNTAHWVLVWDRTLNQCASWYTGAIQTSENPANGNIWSWCGGNCSQTGSNPAPVYLNATCNTSAGFGLHGSEMSFNGLYVRADGPCNGIVNSQTIWQINTNNLVACNGSNACDSGGHAPVAYSTIYENPGSFHVAPIDNPTNYTIFHAPIAEDQHGGEQWSGTAGDTNPWLAATTMDTASANCTTSAYCYEIIALRHNGVIARFTPSYYIFTTDPGELGPIAAMTRDGFCIVFNSNWNETLGTDQNGLPRKDLFSVCNLQ